MANTIKLKTGSGSDPSASDLIVGEIAIRTDNGKLFTKKDNGSVAEISGSGGGGIDDGDKGDITVSNGGDTFTIDNGVVTHAKYQDVAQQTIIGRALTGTGDVTALSAANVRAIINVENGATADQTDAEIKTAYENNSDTNAFTDALLSKLNGIAASATNVTNNNQLTNGAGYITATLTNEQVQDIVGGMVSSNTESGITVTYQDSDGTLDFSVASQTDENFTTTLKNKLDGIAASATNVTNNNQLTNGAGYITATLTQEQVEDFVGGMVTGNTETGITVTYQDSDGTLDFVVGGLTNSQIDSSAAIAGTKISPDFGSQNIVTTGDIALPDNSKVFFGDGTSGQFRIYHQNVLGSVNNRIEGESGTPIQIKGYVSETSAVFNIGGAAELYHDGSKKIETVTGGATITGVCTATSFAGDGSNLTGISAGGPTGGGSDKIFFENAQTVTTNYTIGDTFGAACNAMAAGPITVDSGATVTVGSGETLTIV